MSPEKSNKVSSGEDSDSELEKTIRDIKKTSRFPGTTGKCKIQSKFKILIKLFKKPCKAQNFLN